MNIVFEYIFRDMCYGETMIENDRFVRESVESYSEFRLPPCNKKVSARVNGDSVILKFAYGEEITLSTEPKPFEYSESYETFDDVRYMELCGTVRLEK